MTNTKITGPAEEVIKDLQLDIDIIDALCEFDFTLLQVHKLRVLQKLLNDTIFEITEQNF